MINFLVGILVIIGAVIIALGIMFFVGLATILGFSLAILFKSFVGLFVVVFIIWLIGKFARDGFKPKDNPRA